ncbi:MAG: Peptidase M16 domain containing protein [Candidatus Magnetoglobus multicellularis str. Araruama]|uniref:Peptidase M16 domain containing protein n=1 Tax=Candidatus Magnetoglobus multicellularis str. Araruama TaxID=890399 RepID=A0A1V1PB53_9BACT|nr:MAG: Peptidase M16 domain containing protein [Candidatus Magnetoglobus multicellularis str. Araruama]
MGFWINVGARDEHTNQHGLSHFVEHMVFKGTNTRNAYEIAKALDAIGGQANAMTTQEYSCFYARFYHTHLDKITDILCDMLLSSSFKVSDIDRERQVIFQEIRMFEDDPEDYINYLLGKAYWGEHPVSRSILGTRENIESFNANMIRSYYKERYSPQNIVIALAGKVNHDAIVHRLERVLGGMTRTKYYPISKKKPQAGAQKIIKYRDLEQVHICLGGKGCDIESPERYALTLLNIILGGNMSSLLFQEVREKYGLAYHVFSSLTMYTDSGMQSIYMAVEPSKVNDALKVVYETLDCLIEKQLSQTIIREAKEYTKAIMQLAQESVNNQMVRLGQSELMYNRYVSVEEIIENIDKITPADIQELAKNVLNIDQMAMAFLGPVEEIDTES